MEPASARALAALLAYYLACNQHQHHSQAAPTTEPIATSQSAQQANWTSIRGEQPPGSEPRTANQRSAFILIASLSALCLLAMAFLAYGLFSRAEAIKDDDAAAEMDMDHAMFGAHDEGAATGFGD